MKAPAGEMGFEVDADASIVIPSDYSQYIMYFLMLVIFAAAAKITYRYNTSFRAEHEVHGVNKKSKPAMKKKRY